MELAKVFHGYRNTGINTLFTDSVDIPMHYKCSSISRHPDTTDLNKIYPKIVLLNLIRVIAQYLAAQYEGPPKAQFEKGARVQSYVIDPTTGHKSKSLVDTTIYAVVSPSVYILGNIDSLFHVPSTFIIPDEIPPIISDDDELPLKDSPRSYRPNVVRTDSDTSESDEDEHAEQGFPGSPGSDMSPVMRMQHAVMRMQHRQWTDSDTSESDEDAEPGSLGSEGGDSPGIESGELARSVTQPDEDGQMSPVMRMQHAEQGFPGSEGGDSPRIESRELAMSTVTQSDDMPGRTLTVKRTSLPENFSTPPLPPEHLPPTPSPEDSPSAPIKEVSVESTPRPNSPLRQKSESSLPHTEDLLDVGTSSTPSGRALDDWVTKKWVVVFHFMKLANYCILYSFDSNYTNEEMYLSGYRKCTYNLAEVILHNRYPAVVHNLHHGVLLVDYAPGVNLANCIVKSIPQLIKSIEQCMNYSTNNTVLGYSFDVHSNSKLVDINSQLPKIGESVDLQTGIIQIRGSNALPILHSELNRNESPAIFEITVSTRRIIIGILSNFSNFSV
jgi:hypothetical protein